MVMPPSYVLAAAPLGKIQAKLVRTILNVTVVIVAVRNVAHRKMLTVVACLFAN